MVDEETRASIRSLEHHIGFKYLCAKLGAKRTELERALFTEHFKDVGDFYAVQSKIQALKFFETEVAKEVRAFDERPQASEKRFQFTPQQTPQDIAATLSAARANLPLEREQAAFAAVQQFVELVGTAPTGGTTSS